MRIDPPNLISVTGCWGIGLATPIAAPDQRRHFIAWFYEAQD
jgi:hypothetical protein